MSCSTSEESADLGSGGPRGETGDGGATSVWASLPALGAASVAALAFLLAAGRPTPTNDLAIFVAMGREMLETGSLLGHETFTFTCPGQEFIHGTWGFSLLAALFHGAGGYDGLRLLSGAAVALTCLLVFAASRKAGAHPAAAALATLYGWLLLLQNTAPRGQTLVWPLFAGLIFLLSCRPTPRRAFLISCILGAGWAALHGSFPAGMAWAGLTAAGLLWDGQRARGAAALAAAGGLGVGSLIGPNGPLTWVFIAQNSLLPRERALTEWDSPDLVSFAGVKLGIAILTWVIVLALLPLARRGEVLLSVPIFGLLAVTGTRFIGWFGLATAVLLATSISTAGLPRREARTSPGAWALFAIFWLPVLAMGTRAGAGLHPDTPVDLARALQEDARSGRVFAPMEWGGYLAVELDSPGVEGGWRHFLDVRVWVFPEHTWREFIAISAAEEGWGELLRSHQVTHLLLSDGFHGETLIPAARGSPDWEELASDETGALFRRRAGAAPGAAPAREER